MCGRLSIVFYSEPRLGSPPELSRVAMVQSTDPRNRDDLPHVSRLNRTFFRSVFLESEVRSVFVVIDDIRPNHSAKLRVINRDDVIEAVFP
jgi:hypothetical protein